MRLSVQCGRLEKRLEETYQVVLQQVGDDGLDQSNVPFLVLEALQSCAQRAESLWNSTFSTRTEKTDLDLGRELVRLTRT